MIAVWMAALGVATELHAMDGRLKRAMDGAAASLLYLARQDGRFTYRINTNPNVTVKPRYNVLRHAGAIYAMVMHYQVVPNQQMHTAIVRSGRWLRRSAIGPVAAEPHMLAVWSSPEVNGGNKPLQAKLGGAGLGLVALLSIESIDPGFSPMADLRKLGRFITFMQKRDGSFYSKYVPSEGGRKDDWISLYYPGEAALGLVMLYEKDPDPVWIRSAVKALAYLARKRQFAVDIPADHWALLATARFLSAKTPEALSIQQEELIAHAKQIVKAMLDQQITDPTKYRLYGGFTPDGRTTPTATRLEGLLAAMAFMPQTGELFQSMQAAVDPGISFLLRAQIKEGDYAGAFPRAISKLSPVFIGATKFNRRATEVRIDYIQHSLCALIQYALLSEE